MSTTVTARRNRYEFLLTQLTSTNLFCRQLLLEIYNKQGHDKPTRETLVGIRSDIDRTEMFRHELLIKFPYFERVFRQCCDAFIALMYIDSNVIELNEALPAHFVFQHFLQVCFAKPILLEEDDKHGHFFMQFLSEWPIIIKTFIKYKQIYSDDAVSLNSIAVTQARADDEEDDISIFTSEPIAHEPKGKPIRITLDAE